MKYLIGVDGGGTKTEAVLCDDTGRVIRRRTVEATNPNGQPLQQAEARFKGLLREIAAGFDVDSVFSGVAGTGAGDMRECYQRWAREALPDARGVRHGSDVVCTATSVLGRADGIAAIAGTGSSTFVRRSGVFTQVGGWGYFFEDAGSGFEFGRHALMHWMQATDGRAEPSPLSRLCREAAGGEALEILTELYTGGRTKIASFAPCVFQAAEAGDETALRIIEAQAQGYARLLRTGAKLLRGTVRVALGGSIWKQQRFRERVEALLGDGFRLEKTDLPPAFGAVREAGYDAGLSCGADFEKAFRESCFGQ